MNVDGQQDRETDFIAPLNLSLHFTLSLSLLKILKIQNEGLVM